MRVLKHSLINMHQHLIGIRTGLALSLGQALVQRGAGHFSKRIT